MYCEIIPSSCIHLLFAMLHTVYGIHLNPLKMEIMYWGHVNYKDDYSMTTMFLLLYII